MSASGSNGLGGNPSKKVYTIEELSAKLCGTTLDRGHEVIGSEKKTQDPGPKT